MPGNEDEAAELLDGYLERMTKTEPLLRTTSSAPSGIRAMLQIGTHERPRLVYKYRRPDGELSRNTGSCAELAL
jgi:hypothetical protein